jgi:hypothetical protein
MFASRHKTKWRQSRPILSDISTSIPIATPNTSNSTPASIASPEVDADRYRLEAATIASFDVVMVATKKPITTLNAPKTKANHAIPLPILVKNIPITFT